MTERKHICWLIPDDRGGGVASVAVSCCRQAAAAGHDVTLLIMLRPTGHLDEYSDLRVESLRVEKPGTNAPSALIKWLSDYPQDVLFLNGCEQADVAIPYLPGPTRCVYVVHDTARRYWAAVIRNEGLLDAVVAVSETVADTFRSRLRNRAKLTVVHNGTLFPEIDGGVKGDLRKNDLIFLGGDEPIKGSYDVLAVWRELAHSGFEGRLHWFGEVGPAMKSQVKALPREEQVLLHGRVARSQIFRHASGAKVLLMLSRVESFGMATVECMGMGCIPVAWDIPTGTKEIVDDRKTGFFAHLGDTNALAEQVLNACERHEQMCQAAMRHARERFSEQAMWRGYESLVQSLVEAAAVVRPLAGQDPPRYRARVRVFQLLPASLRQRIRAAIGRSARLGYWLRDLRGF